jgi:hypothetical protein
MFFLFYLVDRKMLKVRSTILFSDKNMICIVDLIFLNTTDLKVNTCIVNRIFLVVKIIRRSITFSRVLLEFDVRITDLPVGIHIKMSLVHLIEWKIKNIKLVFMLCLFCQSFVVDPNKCNYKCGAIVHCLFF